MGRLYKECPSLEVRIILCHKKKHIFLKTAAGVHHLYVGFFILQLQLSNIDPLMASQPTPP